ncbi:hypothetical protein F5Y00DRAFT_266398 [Daldinia vernicosa]|uniref:uncharacterized protein n=1 Tax=Daldinia vernicosa TaxID=114800 RepID=UPI0020089CB9|nr:uncharacterized protein F5Y00DRAFT_266398 [Daldinia vernicosa]KAI0844570.1 hypothetical protein F5Y00DRAFT_266398 [Daldinia vernicosa]
MNLYRRIGTPQRLVKDGPSNTKSVKRQVKFHGGLSSMHVYWRTKRGVRNTFTSLSRIFRKDQECLPQPKEESPEEHKREQQLGVQSMDIVYNRALVTTGLHDRVLVSQAQIHEISVLGNNCKAHGVHLVSIESLGHALDFLEMVSLDRCASSLPLETCRCVSTADQYTDT